MPSFSTTTLCAMATFGMVPFEINRIPSVSPRFAVIVVTLYFMSSVPTMSVERVGSPAVFTGVGLNEAETSSRDRAPAGA